MFQTTDVTVVTFVWGQQMLEDINENGTATKLLFCNYLEMSFQDEFIIYTDSMYNY